MQVKEQADGDLQPGETDSPAGNLPQATIPEPTEAPDKATEEVPNAVNVPEPIEADEEKTIEAPLIEETNPYE